MRRSSGIQTLATLGVVILAALTPYLPVATVLGFAMMPPHFYPILALIILAYVISTEMAKYIFYRQRAWRQEARRESQLSKRATVWGQS